MLLHSGVVRHCHDCPPPNCWLSENCRKIFFLSKNCRPKMQNLGWKPNFGEMYWQNRNFEHP